MMFESLKRLYTAVKINESKLDVAISKGWITLEQKAVIMAV